MKIISLFSVLFTFASSAMAAVPAQDPKELLISNLSFMKSVYEAQYAPKEWKKKFANWDLNQAYSDAVQSVNGMQTNGSELDPLVVRDIVKKFIYSTRDYHVSVRFRATEAATLPFSVKSAEGKVFLAYIDRAKLSTSTFPFSVGDELIEFGGKSAQDAIKEVQEQISENISTTDRGLAEVRLTARKAASGIRVPQGAIELKIKPKGSEAVKSIELHWDYTPEKIVAFPGGQKKMTLAPSSRLSNLKMAAFEGDSALTGLDANPFTLGAKKSYLPVLGQRIWQADESNTFDAYMIKNADRRIIGVVRIPGYSYDTPAAYVKAVMDFAKIIALFETTTDAMVIDQINNPGGSVFYLYQIASMLSDQALRTPRHRMALMQSDIAEAVNTIEQLKNVVDDASAREVLGDNWNGFPMNYETAQFVRGYSQFQIDEWNKGKKLTDPYFIGGANLINPSPIHYTKPILLLVNELCFSGGDFFPAIMQDNKRATIMGVRTAGAGGYVLTHEYPNALGVESFRVTASIAERVDLNPIENLGVKPDWDYALTAYDLQNGFAGYKSAVKSAVESLIK